MGETTRIYYYKNEGPFCGCWVEGWLGATADATEEEIKDALNTLAEEMSEACYMN